MRVGAWIVEPNRWTLDAAEKQKQSRNWTGFYFNLITLMFSRANCLQIPAYDGNKRKKKERMRWRSTETGSNQSGSKQNGCNYLKCDGSCFHFWRELRLLRNDHFSSPCWFGYAAVEFCDCLRLTSRPRPNVRVWTLVAEIIRFRNNECRSRFHLLSSFGRNSGIWKWKFPPKVNIFARRFNQPKFTYATKR